MLNSYHKPCIACGLFKIGWSACQFMFGLINIGKYIFNNLRTLVACMFVSIVIFLTSKSYFPFDLIPLERIEVLNIFDLWKFHFIRKKFSVVFALMERYAWSSFLAGTALSASMFHEPFSVTQNICLALVLLDIDLNFVCRPCSERCKKCPICRVSIEERMPVYYV